ncbi:hypothetical protein PC9H_006715 [Pleurotus ostreatus]|uniref:Ribonuclease H1 N-terminal domain-containing protein n=1 Tax=Pleurotus ostreatus TaxID=5322 RepID=A0A8H6ZWR8_PLEOS|nr:uncharacterized protein PC9H_006715 [Pleurotus ostreatus]KAF7431000.1 hypothetical protein PC9H_006715 [Pleurotus ostreatus]
MTNKKLPPAEFDEAPAVAPPAVAPPAAPAVAPPAVAPPAAPAVGTGPPAGFTTPWVVPIGYAFHLPNPDDEGPFYMITRGREVGIFAGWDITSPLVTGVPGAVFRAVPSIAAAQTRMVSVIASGASAIIP